MMNGATQAGADFTLVDLGAPTAFRPLELRLAASGRHLWEKKSVCSIVNVELWAGKRETQLL